MAPTGTRDGSAERRNLEKIIAAIVARKEATGMTWREIAKRSGVCYHTILGWIEKRHAPHLDSLEWVLYVLGMRLVLERIEEEPKSKERNPR